MWQQVATGMHSTQQFCARQKTLYPPNLYEKMRRFYAQHDPTKLTSISRGNVAVDEAALDAELKSKFGVGLESVQ